MRLVLVFALVAVLPGALVYAASVLFIGRSIESWFDVRVDRALEGGLNLGRNALDYLKQETVNKANQIALTLAEGGPGTVTTRLNRAAEQAGVYEAALFSSTGGVLAVAGVGGSTAPPEPPPAAALRRARLQQSTATPEQTPEGVLQQAARRGAGQHRRPAGAAQGAAGHRARAEGAAAGLRERFAPDRTTTRRSRSRARG